ncbi:hypothetical protein F6W99_02523 [Mycobacterium tuberculosis]|nr:hypothetical protein F6W99_02523 [Mycobacterium tuberculosis]
MPGRFRLCHVGLLRALHEDPHTGVEPGAVTAHRDCQHPRPACGDEPFNPACVLVRTDGPDDRKCEMTAIRFDAHRSGRECHAVLIAAFLLEPGEAHCLALTFTGSGVLPVPVRIDSAANAVGVSLFRALRPPHRPGLGVDTHLVLDGVPPFTKHPQRRLDSPDTSNAPRLDIGFQSSDRPVVGLAASAEMPRQRAGLVLGWVQREPERLHTPAFWHLESGHQAASASPTAAARARLAPFCAARSP